MSPSSDTDLLQRAGLKATAPRLRILRMLEKAASPLSAYAIRDLAAKSEEPLAVPTIYRALEAFSSAGIVHRHACDGGYTLCTHPSDMGVHGYLHCHGCGGTEEFVSSSLQGVIEKEARARSFHTSAPLLEVIGTCARCS
jgi:Fur family transcriptional regulator, zinc uptake regulator